MTIKYYCFRSTAEEGGVGSSLNGYVYFPTTIEAQVTQALVARDIAYLATSEDQLVVLTLDNNAVYADNLSEGLPTKLSSDSGWFGLVNVASLERYEQGDISDTPAKKYIDQIKTLKGDTLSLRTKTSELENDSGFVTEDQLATKQDKLIAGDNISISEDGTISANITSSDSSYELPTASTTTLGGVKVDGTTITIDENGVISSTASGEGSGVTSVNEKTGDVVLTGADINVTYTHDLEETTTGLNSFASSVDASLSNLTELVGDSYTQNNLVGSENVQIVDETEGNGDINSDTNLYITFDESNTFEDKSLKQTKFQVLNNPSDIVLTEGAFGTGLESCSSGNITLKNETNLTTNSLQNVAFWFKMPQAFGRLRIILAPNESIADLTQATEVYEIRYQEETDGNGNIMYFLAANQNSLANSGYAVQAGYYYNNLINGVINESGWNYIVFTKIGEQFAITLNGNQLYNDIPTYAFVNSEFNTVMLTSTATTDGVNYIYNIDELNIINNNSNYWNIQAEQSTPIVLTGKKQIQQNKLLTTDTHQSISGSKSFESFTYFMGGVNVISNDQKQINIYGESYQTPIIINQHTSGITDGEISNVSIRDYGTLKSQQKVSVNSSEGTTTTEIKSCVDGLNTTSLSVVAYTNGNGYAALDNIALSDEDNSNKIPTTAWVNQRIESHTPANAVTGVGITSIVRITQSEYDALTTKDENTFYVIVGE